MTSRYFTKSKYQLARECPRKLWYYDRPQEYENQKTTDSLLEALAEGGFQVGELAKCYYPGGHHITSPSSDQALAETATVLQQENVIIYEAAIAFDGFLVRVDILEKQGQSIRLLEVKAKSFEPQPDKLPAYQAFLNQRDLKSGRMTVTQAWQPHLYDVAFQTWVCQQAHPDWQIRPYLVLVDKTKTATVEGLNQRFFLSRQNRKTQVMIKGDVSREALGEPLLCEVEVGDLVTAIHGDTHQNPSFVDEVTAWGKAYLNNQKLSPCQGIACKTCEFKSTPDSALKSGFQDCWQEWGLTEEQVQQPFMFDIWNFRGTQKILTKQHKILVKDLTSADLKVTKDDRPGLSPSQRQWEQIKCIQEGRNEPYLNQDGLRTVLSQWHYPLHFIDFETAMVAIPFHACRRPYEQIAFQFSHHRMDADGGVCHAGQYLHTEQGQFPNFEFLRELKQQLNDDQGTILRYANHENTVLCQIYDQLEASSEPDKGELQAFIQQITTPSSQKRTEFWDASRAMVDLLEIVKRYYYDPYMGGSNSIKKLLPAVLKRSKFLQDRYSQPIYGTTQFPSQNFKNKVWVTWDSRGLIQDPYQSLPPIFETDDRLDVSGSMVTFNQLADGGAAMTAYARMQFTEMEEVERTKMQAALLRYCELDTLAMVMVVEYWQNLCGLGRG